MTFERVPKSPGGGATRAHPQLVVYPNGNARFNTAAGETWLQEVDYVEFYVDREAQRLGIARGGDPDGAWTLTEDGRGYNVSARSFLQQFGIGSGEITASVYLELERDHEEGLLIADAEPLFEEAEAEVDG